MIFGIFKFTFYILPKKIYEKLVKSFPWFIRLLRVLSYGMIWVFLTFWPMMPINFGFGMPDFLAYIWVAIALIGSVWGALKLTVPHWKKKRIAKKKKNKAEKMNRETPPPPPLPLK